MVTDQVAALAASLLLLSSCDVATDQRRANWAEDCVERGQDATSCVEAAFRLYPDGRRNLQSQRGEVG